MTQWQDSYHCPNCGAELSAKAIACPECGSDEQTGWKENSGFSEDPGQDDDEYEDQVSAEFGKPNKHNALPTWVLIVALLLLALFLLSLIF